MTLSPETSRILEGLSKPIPPVKKSPTYFFGLIATTLFVVLLPILYVLLVIAAAYAVVYHAVENTTIFYWKTSVSLVKIACYFGPIVGGTAMVFFMAKPFFSKRETEADPVEIRESDEPSFFAFVRAVCKAVNSPMPSKIYVDTRVNASASFVKGTDGFFGGKLALTVGTPLIYSMNSREIAGILAHEFGHFSQGTGMRLSFVIRSINAWFQRIVFERDEWDRRLSDSTRTTFYVAVVFYIAMFMVWFTRKVMWCFMTVSHLSSMYLLRQMEFDADRYEIRLAGSSQFPKTAKHLMQLNAASDKAHNSIGHSLSEGTLPDDFGMLTAHFQTKLDPEDLKKIDEYIRKGETSIWSTHPSDRERNDSARREAAPGVFRIDQPMKALFGDIHAVSRKTTVHLYETVLSSFSESQLSSASDVIRKSEEISADYDAFNRFFGNSVSIPTPLSIVSIGEIPSADPHQVVDDIRTKKEILAKANETFDEQFGSLLEIRQGKALMQAGYTIKNDQFGFDGKTIESANRAEMAKRSELDRSYSALNEFHKTYIKRIKSSLGTNAEIIDPAVQESCKSLLRTASVLESSSSKYQQLLEDFHAVKIIIAQDAIENESRWNTITELCESMYDRLMPLYSELSKLPYPFEHAKNGISSAEFILETVPLKSEHQGVYNASESLLNGMAGLYSRILGRVARYVESHESTIGVNHPVS